MSKILIIKPFYVTFEETQDSVSYFYSQYPNASITLLANLFPEDFSRIYGDIKVEEKILYGPHARRLTKLRLFRLCLDLRKKQFDKAFLLIGKPVYDNYKKGKLLLSLSGAREARLFYPASKQEAALGPVDIKGQHNNILKIFISSIKYVFNLAWKSLLLIGTVFLFVFFIVLPMKFKKVLSR